MSETSADAEAPETAPAPKGLVRTWGVPVVLFVLSLLSTTYVGAWSVVQHAPSTLAEWSAGWTFSVPLMSILLAHELGHYVAGRLHGVDISPPYFIPIPITLLGTMGAVIQMRGTIRSRDALLDVGASGPLAGLAVALPVLVYGLATSPVEAIAPGTDGLIIEGRGVLYLALLYALKGPIPAGHDILLNPTAFAGWAGLLVTMINLLPVGQLDGGHVAYALFGKRQDVYSQRIRWALPALGVAVSLAYGVPAYLAGAEGEALQNELLAGVHWVVWAGVLAVLARLGGAEHPPTEGGALSPRRRMVALGTLLLFALLFMPSWVRAV